MQIEIYIIVSNISVAHLFNKLDLSQFPSELLFVLGCWD